MLTLVITDGRGEYLERTLTAAQESIPGFTAVIIDDSGDGSYAAWLEATWPQYQYLHHEARQGLGRAVKTAWGVAVGSRTRYVIHLEEDFVLTERMDLSAMRQVMGSRPDLAQLTLKRQPVSVEEQNAGDQVAAAPDAYADRDGWLEHQRLFSYNPSLVRVKHAALALADPDWDGLERGTTNILLRAGCVFGMWGGRADPPRCDHIGTNRSPGYRW